MSLYAYLYKWGHTVYVIVIVRIVPYRCLQSCPPFCGLQGVSPCRRSAGLKRALAVDILQCCKVTFCGYLFPALSELEGQLYFFFFIFMLMLSAHFFFLLNCSFSYST